MAPTLPEVCVIVPVRDDADHLEHTVERLLAQECVDLVAVILAVGPSEDRTEDVAKRLSASNDRVRWVRNEHGGIPQGLNQALAEVSTGAVARVDARASIPDGYLARALRTLSDTGAAVVGAVQNPVGATRVETAIAAAMSSRAGSGGAAYRSPQRSQPARVDTAWLGVFDTAVLRSVGGWDESFARNEDAELNLRLQLQGHHVWLDPRLVVEYRPRTTIRGLARQYWDYGWWRARTVVRHRRIRVRQLVSPIVVIILAASVALGGVFGWQFLAVPMLYLAMLGAAASVQRGPSLVGRVLMVVALATMHLCWGAGFLVSLAASLRFSGRTT